MKTTGKKYTSVVEMLRDSPETMGLADEVEKQINSRQRRERFASLVGNRSYLQVVLDIHMTSTGSMERSAEEQQADVEAVKEWINTWEQCRSTFDSLAWQLGIQAVQDADIAAVEFPTVQDVCGALKDIATNAKPHWYEPDAHRPPGEA